MSNHKRVYFYGFISCKAVNLGGWHHKEVKAHYRYVACLLFSHNIALQSNFQEESIGHCDYIYTLYEPHPHSYTHSPTLTHIEPQMACTQTHTRIHTYTCTMYTCKHDNVISSKGSSSKLYIDNMPLKCKDIA